ncbi:formylglycine-generating enzyme family protein [Bradyrhizobium paxllaeri]|uniref:formylglycine-generating enzyme family protein n=1 Tax=Bradyrhizobium paxllaeri TaxID=190148 RepID=UPI00081032FD|nr:formylglycine-generating enzyme family protein [Bradyrhizobium paxllaeri]
MVWIPGGTFLMGSNAFYREEGPVHRETSDGFWIDRHPVTNAQFDRFVAATGYVTFSERTPMREMYPDAAEEFLVPGSLVFVKPPRPVSLRDHRAWWAYVPGANWRHPNGPNSSIAQKGNHPVVHINYEDAQAYAAWADKALPSEVEWEFAARGGLEGAAYPWGDAGNPEGRHLSNTWQGRFPFENLAEDGFEGTSPVDAFPPNGYGLHDMCGNVWEWTTTAYAPTGSADKSCCQRKDADQRKALRVVKGGSHLCAPNYCLRARPAARQGESIDSSTCHIGFRCVVRGPN